MTKCYLIGPNQLSGAEALKLEVCHPFYGCILELIFAYQMAYTSFGVGYHLKSTFSETPQIHADYWLKCEFAMII